MPIMYGLLQIDNSPSSTLADAWKFADEHLVDDAHTRRQLKVSDRGNSN